LHVETLSTLCSHNRSEPRENYFAGELRSGFTLARHIILNPR